MFGFFKKSRVTKSPADFAQEWRRLRDQYADPAIELAKTKQAVIVSAASVLDRLWNGHGGMSWDESSNADYLTPLREYLATDPMFARERSRIEAALDKIAEAGRENSRRAAEDRDDEEEIESAGPWPGAELELLVRCAVEWCRSHPEPIPLGAEEDYHGHF